MFTGKRLALCMFCAFSALMLAAATPAQATVTVGPDTLVQGGEAEVTVKDPGAAGQTVLVLIDNGDCDDPLYEYVLITPR